MKRRLLYRVDMVQIYQKKISKVFGVLEKSSWNHAPLKPWRMNKMGNYYMVFYSFFYLKKVEKIRRGQWKKKNNNKYTTIQSSL
jgi:hypothetical protein